VVVSSCVRSRKIMHPSSPAARVMTPNTSILDRFTSLVSDRARLNDESLVDSAPAVFPVPDLLEAWLDEGSSEDDPSLTLFAMVSCKCSVESSLAVLCGK
jgi:hypothetical protein